MQAINQPLAYPLSHHLDSNILYVMGCCVHALHENVGVTPGTYVQLRGSGTNLEKACTLLVPEFAQYS